ncbi:beta-glucosidase 47 [Actinidia rufa]|uniref:Beta-glucosidase 47 n=1 Tax=Actinidia rufa TaxID=165716 RepID=A0A7J0DGK6_9ERIC|nr:beta-glucosidase 47 [Actinidia rufa]
MSPMSQTHLHATQGISSAQIEGAILEDGKNLSNWDVFTHRQGTIKNGENGDVAEDHYHPYLEDIDILHSLGVSAYRFSISWARVLPRGKFGEVNPNGVKFYNNIIDNLLLKAITIAHHDFPQELEDRYGSWLSPLMQEEFAYYANTCFRNFGDRVKYWITINEPNLFTDMAYIKGIYPPANCSEPFGNCSTGNSDTEPLIVMHNLLLAHAKAANLKKYGGFIGIVASAHMYRPLTDDVHDREAATRAFAFNVACKHFPLIGAANVESAKDTANFVSKVGKKKAWDAFTVTICMVTSNSSSPFGEVETPVNFPPPPHIGGGNAKCSSVGVNPGYVSAELELFSRNGFCHHVGGILVHVNLHQLHKLLLHYLVYPMIANIDVFSSGMIRGILVQVHSTLAITMHYILSLLQVQLLEKTLHPQHLSLLQ